MRRFNILAFTALILLLGSSWLIPAEPVADTHRIESLGDLLLPIQPVVAEGIARYAPNAWDIPLLAHVDSTIVTVTILARGNSVTDIDGHADNPVGYDDMAHLTTLDSGTAYGYSPAFRPKSINGNRAVTDIVYC